MSTDSTYRFFHRGDAGGADEGRHAFHAAPTISTTRVVQRGGLRGSSVPPIHLGAKASRASSVAPPSRSFARPTPVIHTVTSASSSVGLNGPSFSRLSFAAPSKSSSVATLPFASVSGYQPRPVARRASIAAPGGSTLRIWSVGSTAPSASSSQRGITEVTKVGATAPRPIYRPSTQAGFGRSSVRIGPSQAGVNRSSISISGGGGGAGGSTPGRSRPGAVSRWASVGLSGFGGGRDDGLGFGSPPPVRSQQRGSYVGGGRGGGEGGGGGGAGKSFARSADKFYSTSGLNVRANDVSSGEGRGQSKTSENDVQHRKKYDYEKQMAALLPAHEDSLANLRARTQVAKDHLSRHRILLDRYLPLQLGPDNDVVDEVESRYGELLSRMPHLESRGRFASNRDKDEYVSVIAPYKPASATPKAPKLSYDIANTPVQKSFTQKISDTRKRARSVLCKIKGDPKYFDFS